MKKDTRIQILECAIQQMLSPLKNIPFDLIIKSLSQFKVIKLVKTDQRDAALLKRLEGAIRRAGEAVHQTPIRRPRPNEVGNDIEPFVLAALEKEGFRATRPTSSSGKKKSTGYPDILFYDEYDRPTYLECKIYADGADPTTMRSFYLSPSEAFKVSMDARHLLLAYSMNRAPIPGSNNAAFTPTGFKLVDLHDLLCDVKYEFNSDNRRLYSEDLVLLTGAISPPQ